MKKQRRKYDQFFKYFLSFFLVLGAVLFASQYWATAFAAGSDRIYYFNMDANGVEGNMILVETDGHWGLMDAGHTSSRTITDASGRTYSTTVNGLSSQIYCRNGKDVANYMINVLGVKHLDFVVGTHAHSDHVGGIPEVAAATYRDASGVHRLVDGRTTYYYKEYQHISDLEDDLVQYSSSSWHNQAFAYQAKTAMSQAGAVLVNVADGRVVTKAEQANYGDYIQFKVGDMTFRLYNLDEQTYSGNENVNSIVTVMSNGNYTVVNLADINTNNGAIDKVSKAIAKDYGTVDVVVAGHHGYAGSNTKSMFDSLQPGFVVVSNGMGDSWLYTDGDLAAAMPYSGGLFGTKFYNTSISPYAVVTDLSGKSVYVYSVQGNGDLTDAMAKLMKASNKTGWASWVNTEGTLWSYLESGKSVKNAWRRVNGKMYHFDKTGIMDTGWYTDQGGTRWLNDSGALVTGWQLLDNKWYYFESQYGYRVTNSWQRINGKMYHFDANGVMNTGWFDDGEGVRWLNDSGALVTGWQLLDGKWYYFESKYGYKVTNGWQRIDGKMYHFDANGIMETGWYDDGQGVRWLNDSGALVTGWRQINGEWFYFESKYGYKVTNSWQRFTDGKMRYLGADGTMQTGWQEDDGGTRWLDSNGALITGWREINGKWYYFESKYGYKLTNTWQRVNGKMYHFGANGVMDTGWYTDDGGIRWLNDSGALVTGWQQIDGKWYYFESKYGYKVTNGWQRFTDGKMRYLGADGTMETGWQGDNGGSRYLDDSGALVTGWQLLDGKWYYFESKYGYKLTNTWQRIDGKMYHFDADGVMQTGWYDDEGGTRWLNDSGALVTGWQYIEGKWRFFESNYGYLQTMTGWQRINGVMRLFDDNGDMQTGWYDDGQGIRWLDPGDGSLTVGWKLIDNSWYYFENSYGYMVTDWQQIGGKWYYFYEDGRMAADTKIDGYYVDSNGVWIK